MIQPEVAQAFGFCGSFGDSLAFLFIREANFYFSSRLVVVR